MMLGGALVPPSIAQGGKRVTHRKEQGVCRRRTAHSMPPVQPILREPAPERMHTLAQVQATVSYPLRNQHCAKQQPTSAAAEEAPA